MSAKISSSAGFISTPLVVRLETHRDSHCAPRAISVNTRSFRAHASSNHQRPSNADEFNVPGSPNIEIPNNTSTAIQTWKAEGIRSILEDRQTRHDMYQEPFSILFVSSMGWRAAYAVKSLEKAASSASVSRKVTSQFSALQKSYASLSDIILPARLTNAAKLRGISLSTFPSVDFLGPFNPETDLQLFDLIVCLDQSVRNQLLTRCQLARQKYEQLKENNIRKSLERQLSMSTQPPTSPTAPPSLLTNTATIERKVRVLSDINIARNLRPSYQYHSRHEDIPPFQDMHDYHQVLDIIDTRIQQLVQFLMANGL